MKQKTYINLSSQLDLPFLETNRNLIEEIFKTLKLKFGLTKNSKQKLIDLGSGNGQIVIYSALNYEIKSVGIEINQSLIKEAKNKIRSLKKQKCYQSKGFRKIKFVNGDLFDLDLNNFDFVYIFSLPTMQKYLRHLFLTIKKDAILISYKYPLKNYESIMSLEYELKSEYKNQSISTFFYKKI